MSKNYLEKEEDRLVDLIEYHLKAASNVADFVGLKNLFYNEQFIEVIVAAKLGHKYNIETRGPDAFDVDGFPAEYKSVNVAKGSVGAFQFHWLSHNKIASSGELKDVYFIVRNNLDIIRIYKLPMAVLYNDLCSRSNGSINGHKSYGLHTIVSKGAVLVYNDKTKQHLLGGLLDSHAKHGG